MPRMRGKEATKHIREIGYDGVIIGVTGNAMDEDIREFISSGADLVLPKPFDIEQFLKHVNELRAQKEKLEDMSRAV